MEHRPTEGSGRPPCLEDSEGRPSPSWPANGEVTLLSEELTQEVAAILQERQALSNPVECIRRALRDVLPPGRSDPALIGRSPRRRQRQIPLRQVLLSHLKAKVPILAWLPQMTRHKLFRDLVAGGTVGIIVIPQGMSYAAVAGLPYIYGLYTAAIAPIVYGLFGQSRQLAVGPVAVVSLLVGNGLMEVMTEEECPEWFSKGRAAGKLQSKMCPEQYAYLATLTAFVAGVLLLLAYICRLGFLVSFMGHPVVAGYTAGAAVIICLSQLKPILGFNLPQSQLLQEMLEAIFRNLHLTNGCTLGLSVAWLVFLLGCRKVGKRWKRFSLVGAFAPFFSCVVGILMLSTQPGMATQYDIGYVGKLPDGLVPFIAPMWSASALPRVLPTAAAACYVGYIEAIAIGKAMAAKHKYFVEPNQELLTLGLCNLIGSLFGGYPVTGSFSRSAVKLDLNALTQLSSLVTAAVVWGALLFLKPTFYWLPKFVLSTVVISSVVPLCDLQEAYHIYKVSRTEGFLWLVAFAGVLLLGVEIGIGVAVAMSLAVVVSESVRPQLTVLWRIPGTTCYGNMKQESCGRFVEGVLIVRLGASLYFANAQYVKDRLRSYIADLEDANRVEYVVLEMTPVISIDSTAARIMRTLVQELRDAGVELALAIVGNRLVRTLRSAGLQETIGKEWFFSSVHDAVLHCRRHRAAKLLAPGPTVGALAAGTCTPRASQAGLGDEFGFSNSFHPTCTVIFLTLVVDRPLVLFDVASVFKRHSVNVIKAQVEANDQEENRGGAKHVYHVQKLSGDKLSKRKIELLRVEFAQIVRRPEVERAQLVKVVEAALSSAPPASPEGSPAKRPRDRRRSTCLPGCLRRHLCAPPL